MTARPERRSNSSRLKIVSGGQTGVDRAALDVAIALDVEHGGWCPRGRKSESGPIDPRYELVETTSAKYGQRTRWNVRDSDATAIFALCEPLTGGTALTARIARSYGKPTLILTAMRPLDEAADLLHAFLLEYDVRVLNVAGPRGSQQPAAGAYARDVLHAVIPRLDRGRAL